MNQTIRKVSALLCIALGLQSLALTINVKSVHAANTISDIANHVVISQVYPNGADQNNEYVELYNPTTGDIDLSIYDLAVFRNPLVDPTEKTFLAVDWAAASSSTIKAGGYYLVGTTNVTVKDAAYTSNGVQSLHLDDAVALVEKATTNTVDQVGWDSAVTALCETACATTATVLNPVLVRLPDQSEGNGIDTDNNLNDFRAAEATNVSPRNRLTPSVFAAEPIINSVTPADNSFTNNPNIPVSATITEANFDTATLTIDGNPVNFNNRNDNTLTFDPANNLADGAHTASITVTDKAGFSATKNWTFGVDTVRPTLSIENLKTEVTASGAYVTILIRYNDTFSGVTQMRLSTDDTLDTEAWQPLAETVRIQIPAKEGVQTIKAQIRDRASNDSVEASTTADVVTPSIAAPEFALSSTTGSSVTLTWSPVVNAVGYVVRYNDGQTIYPIIATTNTNLTIKNLDLSKNYHFEVAAVSIYGTTSSYTPVYTPEQSPAKDKFMPATTTTTVPVSHAVAETTTITDNASVNRTTPQETVSPTPEATISPAPTPSASGEIKSDTDNRTPDWTKIIVALSILIIAAGVATGGWYLYQWWTGQTDSNNGQKGGRW